MKRIYGKLIKFLKPTDIYTSQRLILFILKLFGYFPLRISGNQYNRQLKVSIIGYVLFVIFLMFYLTCFTITFIHGEVLLSVHNKSLLSRFGGTLKFANLLVLLIVLYVSSICFTKKITTCMQSIFNIDMKLNLIGIEINYWKGFRYGILFTCFLTVHFILTLMLNILLNEIVIASQPNIRLPVWTSFFSHHMTLVTMTLFECYFACIMFEIRSRFEAMNRVSHFNPVRVYSNVKIFLLFLDAKIYVYTRI